MNILFLSEMFYPHGSGAEVATSLYADLLSKSGFNVRVITNKFANEPNYSNNGSLVVYRLPLFQKTGSIKYSILRRVDVLSSAFLNKMLNWADTVYIPRFWYSAIPLAKAHKKPVIVHLHDYISNCPLSTLYDMSKEAICTKSHRGLNCQKCIYIYEKYQNANVFNTLGSVALNSLCANLISRSVHLADSIVCVSNAQKNLILLGNPFLADKVSVIYNPIFNIKDSGIKGKDFGYFGGKLYVKGFHNLYQAMFQVRQGRNARPRVHITRFFSGESQSNSLKALGFIPYEKLSTSAFESVYGQISCIIAPSIWAEPWGYAVSEALLAGRLVITSRVGGIAEQTEGCKGVLSLEPNNVEQLAEAITSVHSLSREKMINLGLENAASFRKRQSNDKSLKSFIKVCEQVSN